MKSTRIFRILFGILAATLLCTAEAAVMVSNLAEPTTDSFTADNTGPEAMGFTTGATQTNLTSITIRISEVSDNSGNFTLRLFTDNGGVPGTVVAGGLLSGSANPAVGDNTYTPTAPLSLQPNTQYWVVAQVSSGEGSYNWAYTYTTNHTGSWILSNQEAYSGDGGVSWENDNGILLMSVSADIPSSTPVPTLSEWGKIFLSSLLAAVAIFTLRRKRT